MSDNHEGLLDGLAWAGIPERVRIARIAHALVEEQSDYEGETITQVKVKDRIKSTFPPHGRGAAIFRAIFGHGSDIGEFKRQYRIFRRRKDARVAFNGWLEKQKRLETRLNNAYAAAFDRPQHEPKRTYPGSYSDYEQRKSWDEAEQQRDKGDVCLAITHQGEHVVALVSTENGATRPHIAVRRRRGPITRTYLRGSARTFVEAAVRLGGTRVKAAIGKGKRVETDWIARETRIHHDGSDHVAVKVETIPWETCTYETSEETDYCGNPITRIKGVETLTLGDRVTRVGENEIDELDYYV